MSRCKSGSASAAVSEAADATFNPARIAEEIGVEALGMAQWARAAGLTTLGALLESAALEAGAQVAALQWPEDAPKP